MKFQVTSEIKVNIETGKRSLVVYYDAEKDDYDEAITKALGFHGLKHGEVSVIAYPIKRTHSGDAHTLKRWNTLYEQEKRTHSGI